MANPLDFAIVILGILLVITGSLLLGRRLGRREILFTSRPLLSPLEAAFFSTLEEAAGSDWRLLAKVPLPLLIEPAPQMRGRRRRRAAERLQGQLIDFVLCREEDLRVGVAILLTDDPQKKKTLEESLASAGVPLLGFPPLALPTMESLRQALERISAQASFPGESDSGEDWQLGGLDWLEEEADDWQIDVRPPAEAPPVTKDQAARDQAELLCPECASPMIKRRMVRGPHAGREFWVCPRYPDCRGLLPVLEP